MQVIYSRFLLQSITAQHENLPSLSMCKGLRGEERSLASTVRTQKETEGKICEPLAIVFSVLLCHHVLSVLLCHHALSRVARPDNQGNLGGGGVS